MARRKRRWSRWIGVAGLLVWGLLLYRSYGNLAIPAFGPPEQATLAVKSLLIRYGAYLAAGGAAWFALERAERRRIQNGSERPARSVSPSA